MRRSFAVVVLAAVAAFACPPALAAPAPWQKLSTDDVSGTDGSALVVSSGRVIAAWPSGSGTDLAGAVAFRGFAPTPGRSLAGAGPIATAISGFTSESGRPGLVIGGSPLGVRVVSGGTIAGQDHVYLSDPLTEGATPPAGPTIISTAFNGDVDAVGLPDGGIIVANDENGVVHTFRDSAPLDGSDLQTPLGGCCSYHPAVGVDGAGRVWAAWYSNAAGHIGIYAQQLDAATAAPLGAPQLLAQSASVFNNTSHLALACGAATCRIAYLAQATVAGPLRLVSWAPGEGAPTTIATGLSIGVNGNLAAAFRADGRFWVAWYEPGVTGADAGFRATLGNAKGAGGEKVDIGRPAGFVQAGDLEAASLGENLVLTSTVTTGTVRPALWTTLVQDPSQVIDNPRTIRNGPARVVAPKGISLSRLKRSKCVNVRVTVTRPARVLVAIFSGTRSRRVFGRRIVSFTAPGSKVACVRVPFRARTFNVRTPVRIAIAVRQGGAPAKVVTKGFRFF